MRKKIGLGLMILIGGLTAFAYVQLSIAKKEITQLLNRHDITSEEPNIGIFPPALNLQQLKFTATDVRVEAKKLSFIFNPLFLITGKLRVEDILLSDAAIYKDRQTESAPDYQIINLNLKTTALNTEDLPELLRFLQNKHSDNELSKIFTAKISLQAENRQNDKITFSMDSSIQSNNLIFDSIQIGFNPAQTSYQNRQQVDFSVGKGAFSKLPNAVGYEILADNWVINGENFGLMKGNILLPKKQENRYIATLTADHCSNCTATFELEKTAAKQRKLTFQTDYFPLEKLLKAVKLPVFAGGKGSIIAELELRELQPEKGKFLINTLNGSIRGLNILQLIGQYLPINYNVDNQMQTDYERFIARLDWDRNNLTVEDLYLRSKELLIEGKGKIELDKMKCEIKLTIGVNNPKYKKLKLPMRFFDNCYSPQYKIDIDKDFREHLKNYIKQRIKE